MYRVYMSDAICGAGISSGYFVVAPRSAVVNYLSNTSANAFLSFSVFVAPPHNLSLFFRLFGCWVVCCVSLVMFFSVVLLLNCRVPEPQNIGHNLFVVVATGLVKGLRLPQCSKDYVALHALVVYAVRSTMLVHRRYNLGGRVLALLYLFLN